MLNLKESSMATKRKVNIRKAPAAVAQKKERREHRHFAGGVMAEAGTTASVSGLLDMVKLDKGIFGLFESGGGLHHTVIQGDVMDANGIDIVEPVYSHKDLLKVYMSSSILRQCVDAMVTNIESYGIDFEYIGPLGGEDGRGALNEKARIQRLLATLTSDGRTIQAHRENSRVDKEVLGARCFEVIRDAADRVVAFDHVHTNTIRMTSKEKEAVYTVVTDPVTGARKETRRRFRRFVQMDRYGKRTYFKELGDPRPISPETGKVDNTLAIEDQATEIFYEGMYCPGTPLGVPRWAGVIPALLGSREAEMVNLNFFRDNAIPAMAVLVSGGALTEESFDKIDQYIAGVRGSASMNRIVVMEAVSDGAEASAIDGSLPAPRIDLKPMLSERQHEGLFKEYIKDGERKARMTFRLPPIYVGSAEEYNRASAFASVLTADQQIFVPERMAWDEMFERVVLASHGFKFWRVRSSGPGLQDPQEVSRIVSTLGKEGALTSNVAIKIANRYLDADIKPIAEEWGNLPFDVIVQYIKSGKTIKGLDIFEEELETVIDPLEVDPLNPPKDQAEKIQKMLRGLLDDVSETLQDQLDEAVQSLQSIAREEA
jgi:PBSX family phage portal protein